jgi:hypothetical protein
MRYNSTLALEPNYAADSEKVALHQARAEQALTQARLNRTRDEALRKERILLDTTWRRAQFNPSPPQTSTVGLG